MNLNEKLQIINDWLQHEVLNGKIEDIPMFEKNENTINILYQIAIHNKKQTQIAQLIIQDQQEKILEYQNKSKLIEQILKQSKVYYKLNNNKSNSINITNKNITNNNNQYLQQQQSTYLPIKNNFHVRTLSELAAILKLKESYYPTTFMNALYDLSNEIEKLSNETRNVKKEITLLSNKILFLMKKQEFLNEILIQFEQEVKKNNNENILINRNNTIEYLRKKGKEYEMEIIELKRELNESLSLISNCNNNLNDNNLDNEMTFQKICHQSLLTLYQSILKLQEELEPKLQELQKYYQLPPDINLVKIKLNEEKLNLQQLEEIFHHNVKHIWFD